MFLNKEEKVKNEQYFRKHVFYKKKKNYKVKKIPKTKWNVTKWKNISNIKITVEMNISESKIYFQKAKWNIKEWKNKKKQNYFLLKKKKN